MWGKLHVHDTVSDMVERIRRSVRTRLRSPVAIVLSVQQGVAEDTGTKGGTGAPGSGFGRSERYSSDDEILIRTVVCW